MRKSEQRQLILRTLQDNGASYATELRQAFTDAGAPQAMAMLVLGMTNEVNRRMVWRDNAMEAEFKLPSAEWQVLAPSDPASTE